MLSNQKKIEKYAKNAMEEAGILPSNIKKNKNAKSKKLQIPESLDEGQIKILEMMETNADTDYYINVLKELEQSKSSGQLNSKSLGEVKKIQEICYAEIGRRLIKVKQKDILRDFRKSNVYIRGYLMKGILDYLQEIVKFCPDSIFILPIPDKAINFDAQDAPPQLRHYLQAIQYAQIIRNVNYIIQKNIYRQKYYSPEPSYPFILPLGLFCMIATLLLVTVSNYSNSDPISQILLIITGLGIFVSLILILGFSMNSYQQQVEIVPPNESICDEIKDYFSFLNGKSPHNLQWMIGESFFWIEIKIRNKAMVQEKNSCASENELTIHKRRRISYVGANLIQNMDDED